MSTVNYKDSKWVVTKGDATTEYVFLKKLVDGKTGKGRPSKVKTELVTWNPEPVQLELTAEVTLDITEEQEAVNTEVETETVVLE